MAMAVAAAMGVVAVVMVVVGVVAADARWVGVV